MKYTKKDKVYYYLQKDTTYDVMYGILIRKPRKIDEKHYCAIIKRNVLKSNQKGWTTKKEKVLLLKINENKSIIYLNIV